MMLSDKAFVISTSKQRFEEAAKRLEQVGFTDIQHFRAITPTTRDLNKYCRGRVVPKWARGKKLRHPGALGCLFSHKEVLTKVGQAAFIFEDDIRIHNRFNQLFKPIQCQWAYLGCSQLHWRKMARTEPSYIANWSLGTFAYWVTGKGAAIALSKIGEWPIPIDFYYAAYLQKRYNLFVHCPYLMIADVSKSSTGRGKRDIQLVAKRYGWRLKDYVL